MAKAPSKGRDNAGRFAKGNPGRKPGYRHKVTRAVEELLEGEAEALTRKAIERAKAGDMTALRLCLERIAPARKDAPVQFDMLEIKSVADHPMAVAAIIKAVASGDLTPVEGQALSAVMEQHRRAVEACEFDERLARIEERLGHEPNA